MRDGKRCPGCAAGRIDRGDCRTAALVERLKIGFEPRHEIVHLPVEAGLSTADAAACPGKPDAARREPVGASGITKVVGTISWVENRGRAEIGPAPRTASVQSDIETAPV